MEYINMQCIYIRVKYNNKHNFVLYFPTFSFGCSVSAYVDGRRGRDGEGLLPCGKIHLHKKTGYLSFWRLFPSLTLARS